MLKGIMDFLLNSFGLDKNSSQNTIPILARIKIVIKDAQMKSTPKMPPHTHHRKVYFDLCMESAIRMSIIDAKTSREPGRDFRQQ